MKKIFLIVFIMPFISRAQYMSDIKAITAFIYLEDSLKNPIPNGTCFFIDIPYAKDTTQTFTYLVTAKHVLQKKDGSFHSSILIRMNTVDSSRYTWYPLNLSGPDKNIYLHPDTSVDLAVLPYVPSKKDYNFRFLAPDFLSTKDDFNKLPIEEGTEAFFSGLFVPFTGHKKIYPIVRFGKIALLPDEKIDWIGMKREMLLIETSSFGGNSGSPVYFKVVYPNMTSLILGGVLNGTFRDVGEIKVVQTGPTPVAVYNNGVSGITPAYLLRDILYSPELMNIRSKL